MIINVVVVDAAAAIAARIIIKNKIMTMIISVMNGRQTDATLHHLRSLFDGCAASGHGATTSVNPRVDPKCEV